MYRITVTVDLYWLAPSPPAANDYELGRAVEEEMGMGNATRKFEVVESASDLPDGVADSCPWGDGGDEKSVREWLKS
ncbi:MAG: hypothetical protein O3A14_19920 [Cyanobacteria bacterium]|nr:hypothetical protein [Cyanobacteriota bacterium]